MDPRDKPGDDEKGVWQSPAIAHIRSSDRRVALDNLPSPQILNLNPVNRHFALQNKYIRANHLAFRVGGSMVAVDRPGAPARRPALWICPREERLMALKQRKPETARRSGASRRRTPEILSPDAADPALRGEGRTDVRHGADRRLLPPLYRPGGRGGRHAGRGRGGRHRHHLLPRPRPHAGLRHGPQGCPGRADRPRRRLQPRARAARCTCSPRPSISMAAMASSARRCRSAPASPSPTNIAAPTASA